MTRVVVHGSCVRFHAVSSRGLLPALPLGRSVTIPSLSYPINRVGSPWQGQCFAQQVAQSLGAPTPPTVEPLTIEGTTVAARLSADFGGSTFTVDFAAARSGSCTFFGSFQGIGEPFDAAVVSAMFAAALP